MNQMHLARATYDGKVHAHSINATQPDRWRHKDGVTVIEFDRKTAIAAARFLATHRPKIRHIHFVVKPMDVKKLGKVLAEQSRRIAADLDGLSR